MNYRYCLRRYGLTLAVAPGEITALVPGLIPVPGLIVGSGLSGADGLKFTLGNRLGIVDIPGDTSAEG